MMMVDVLMYRPLAQSFNRLDKKKNFILSSYILTLVLRVLLHDKTETALANSVRYPIAAMIFSCTPLIDIEYQCPNVAKSVQLFMLSII